MKSMKTVKRTYLQRTSAKQRGYLKVSIYIISIFLIVGLFIALVAILATQLKKTDCAELVPSQIPCGVNQDCADPTSDNFNCGKCGVTCPDAAQCINSGCQLCWYNCSTDADPCSIEPCNSTTGCSTFDCANDGDPCTEGSCVALAGCPNICPFIILNPPSSNYAAPTYRDANSPRLLASPNLAVTSPSLILSISISAEATLGPTINRVVDCVLTGNMTSSFNSTSGVYLLQGADTSANYQTTLRTCFFKNPDQTIPSTITFYFLATNAAIQQQIVVTSTLTFAT